MTPNHEAQHTEEIFMGFEIREIGGWYVAVPIDPELRKVFEAESRQVLEHKIRRWIAVG
jgi:hypothetical protein